MEKPNDVLAVISHDVNDYKAWRNFFNSTENFRKSNGILHSDVYQCADDLNKIVVIQRFASMTDAKAFLANSQWKENMKNAGVRGKPNVFLGVSA